MFTLVQSGREYYYKNKDLFTHIISIVCPDDDITPLHDKHIVVKFWDIDHEMTNKFRHYDVVSLDTVLKPVFKAEAWYFDCLTGDKPMRLLVHCDAGVSRSSSVSLGILWLISSFVFSKMGPQEKDTLGCVKAHVEYRKEWCKNRVEEDCVGLRRFIDGRLNPGIIPNQAVLKHYRESLPYFPW